MPKSSFIFKYTIMESGALVIYSHKIRAMNTQEAIARFHKWDSHRENKDSVHIVKAWLDSSPQEEYV